MICRYCLYFDTAKERYKISDKKFKRKCIITNKDKGENDDICDNFLMITSFWCDKNDIRINLYSCLYRNKKKDVDCKNCLQINEIIQLTKERN